MLMAAREQYARYRTTWQWTTDELYLGKMVRWIEDTYHRWHTVVTMVAVAEAAPSYDSGVNTDPTSVGWRYTAHALGYMKHRSANGGARLLMAPIAYGRQLEILQQIAAYYDIEIIDLKALWNGPSFLPNDDISVHMGRV